MSDQSGAQAHLLSLKVLRLSKPSFYQKGDVTTTEMLLKPVQHADLALSTDFGTSDFLVLPPAFGNIYLGETFNAYLCVNNDSLTSVNEVAFKAELQTTSQRFTLADTIGSTPTSSTEQMNMHQKTPSAPIDQVSLLPRQSAEFVLHHEIKELGIHILVCSVHYTPAGTVPSAVPVERSRKFFRKFFKFQVLNPLSVKTKVNSMQDGRVCLEIQLQNLATVPLCLETIGFEANNLFDCQDVNDSPDFHSKVLVPYDTRQYLYILSPKQESTISARTSPNLGRLDIHWKSGTDLTPGHLQTSQLVRRVPTVQSFEVKVIQQPKTVTVEKAFRLKLRIQNNLSGERLRLSVKGNKSKMTNILLKGSNDLDIGVLDGLTHHDFELEFFPILTGFHPITGLSVCEKISGTTVELENLALISVIHQIIQDMSFLFKPKTKSPAELVRSTKELIIKLRDGGSGEAKKANEDISKNLVTMKNALYGDGENEPNPETVSQLATEITNSDLLVLLVHHIHSFEFEAKKDVALIFNNLLRRQIGTRFPTADYIAGKPELLIALIAGYENQDISLNCGMILRESLRHEALCKLILESSQFWKFFQYVELSTFDVASDAFATFKDCLTKHKSLVAGFLEARYDEFFEKYQGLLNSSNYVTKRQSLKLLGELLLDRSNYSIMTKFIASPDNLKTMMNLLREKSRNIQFEAFHVFKIFIANPSKTKPILDILYKNKDRLITFLGNFHNDKAGNARSLMLDDEQFNDEKLFLIKSIEELPGY
ncbi:hypothetical protein HDV03_002843 [Kappamyces sp. JEL0829]|nr:hypothetical protein HDV03_002843 [Kappamyces sp. JEL0829]